MPRKRKQDDAACGEGCCAQGAGCSGGCGGAGAGPSKRGGAASGAAGPGDAAGTHAATVKTSFNALTADLDKKKRLELQAALDALVHALTRLRAEALELLRDCLIRLTEDARLHDAHQPAVCATCRAFRLYLLARGPHPHAAASAGPSSSTRSRQRQQQPQQQQPQLTAAQLRGVPELDVSSVRRALRCVGVTRTQQQAPTLQSFEHHVFHEHFLPFRVDALAGARINLTGLADFIQQLEVDMWTNLAEHYAAGMHAWLKRWCSMHLDRMLAAAPAELAAAAPAAAAAQAAAAAAAAALQRLTRKPRDRVVKLMVVAILYKDGALPPAADLKPRGLPPEAGNWLAAQVTALVTRERGKREAQKLLLDREVDEADAPPLRTAGLRHARCGPTAGVHYRYAPLRTVTVPHDVTTW